MEIKLKNQVPYTTLQSDGSIVMSLWLHNDPDYPEYEAVADAMSEWEGDNSVEISLDFTLKDAVTDLIEGHEMPSSGNQIDIGAKPLFDALRAEMQAQIDRIDALKF
jgi:hypothetical protein